MDGYPRFSLDGQTALVTGAARGLGRAIALAMAHAGADIALGLRDPSSADDLVAEITRFGRRALPLAMDVRDLDQIRSAVAETVAHFGRLDILVNNAGLGPANPAEAVTEEDYDLTFDVNVKGTFFASQAAARIMIGQGYGRIVNLGSQAGAVALPTEAIYCTTKAAISHLTKCLAVEWGRARDHGQHGRAHVHPHPGHRARPCRPGVPRRRDRADRGAPPHRRADGGRRRGDLPGVARRVAGHRHDPARGRRMDGPVSTAPPRRRAGGPRAGPASRSAGGPPRPAQLSGFWRHRPSG